MLPARWARPTAAQARVTVPDQQVLTRFHRARMLGNRLDFRSTREAQHGRSLLLDPTPALAESDPDDSAGKRRYVFGTAGCPDVRMQPTMTDLIDFQSGDSPQRQVDIGKVPARVNTTISTAGKVEEWEE